MDKGHLDVSERWSRSATTGEGVVRMGELDQLRMRVAILEQTLLQTPLLGLALASKLRQAGLEPLVKQ